MTNLDGKVVLITGATSGIGKAAAHKLAKMRAHVIIVGRNRVKTESTVQAIKTQSGNPSVDMLLADLSSMKDVRQLAQQFKARYQKLDILINNAGAMFSSRQETIDGYEMTFALNHLAYFLLTNLLLDMLKSGTLARIINVSSGIHPHATIDFDDLHSKTSYRFLNVYAKSKLANVLFTYELARRLTDSNITANALAPGSVATNLGRNNGLFWNMLSRVLSMFMSTPEKGAETIVYLAASHDVEGISGYYFEECQTIKSASQSYHHQTAQRLWDESAKMVGLENTYLELSHQR